MKAYGSTYFLAVLVSVSGSSEAAAPPGQSSRIDGPEIDFEAIPTGIVSGELDLPQGQTLPTRIALRLESSSRATSSTPKISKVSLSCPVTEARWRCRVPSGRLNLRLTAEGFTPAYYWDADVEADKVLDLGVWKPARGASLAGWVATSGSRDEKEPVELDLDRQIWGWKGDPRTGDRVASMALCTRADARGFFQFTGVPEGGYVLTARTPGFAPSQVHDLSIAESGEVFLDEPIVLRKPTPVEILLEPMVGPAESPWNVTLSQMKPGAMVLEPRAEAPASSEGLWRHEGLDPGNYYLQVSTSDGSTWLERWLAVEPEMSTVFVEVPLVEIKGRVEAGDEPLKTKLVFGSTQGMLQIRFESDERGRFSGYLPHEGTWPVDLVTEGKEWIHQAVEPVEIKKRPGKRVVTVAIELPDTLLEGTVVKGGEPVPGAALAILREGEKKRRDGILVTDEKGAFSLRGLMPGTLLVHAYKESSSSPWVRIDLQEDLDLAPLRLEIEEKIELSGLVRSAAGAVPGAAVAAWPEMTDGSLAFVADAQTDVDGSFLLELPHRTATANLIVVAPGYPLRLIRVPITEELPTVFIELEEAGGVLGVAETGAVVLADAADPETERRTIQPTSVLHHRGAAVPVDILARILITKGRLQPRVDRLSLLDMATGEYRLCAAGGSPCDTGFLPPRGELVLEIGAGSS